MAGHWKHGWIPLDAAAKAQASSSKFGGKVNESMRSAAAAKHPRVHEGRVNGTGTKADPIDVNGDLTKAAKLLSEGKHVRLNSVDEVSMLIDKLGIAARDMEAKGQKAPTLDLCRISVPKTNLFCKQSKGIPRTQMPQLGGKAIPGSAADKTKRNDRGEVDGVPAFEKALADAGVKIEHTEVRASHLKASQSELNGVKVAGMMGGFRAGKIKEAPIFVTRDNYIIDGHHRWASKVGLDSEDGILGNEYSMPVKKIDMEIGEALDFANDFTKKFGIASAAV